MAREPANQTSNQTSTAYQAELRYLRNCYEAGTGARLIPNIFAEKIDSRFFLDRVPDSAIADGLVDADFIRSADLARIAVRARAYETELRPMLSAILAVGWIESEEGKREPIAGPLFWFEVGFPSFGGEGGTEAVGLAVDPSSGEWNEELIGQIGGPGLMGQIGRDSLRGGLTGQLIGGIRRAFEAVPNAGVSSLLRFPSLLDERAVRHALGESKGANRSSVELLPVCALLLTRLGPDTRGILAELAEMANGTLLPSPPIRALFAPEASSRETIFRGKRKGSKETTHAELPATLSAAQTCVLDAAKTAPLSVCIGPPGTGKSFTIASIAIEAVLRGESVLIASRMNHAVDVVSDKVAELVGCAGVGVRAGRREYAKQLRDFLDDLLSQVITADADFEHERLLRGLLQELSAEISACGRLLQRRAALEKSWGPLFAAGRPSVMQHWRRGWLRCRLANEPPAWIAARRLHELVAERNRIAGLLVRQRWVNRLQRALAQDRTTFLNLARALRARTGASQRQHFENTNVPGALAALPLWLVNLADAHRAIPMRTAMFDLVIIDEASQCDIASPLPVLQRAKRGVIVGDPRQLRHVSFLSADRQRAFAVEAGLPPDPSQDLDFRNRSILDLALARITAPSRVAFLNEHFRSQPEIVEFSNARFYRGQLKVMTRLRSRRAWGARALAGMQVAGHRDSSGVNQTEGNALLGVLRSFLAEYAQGSAPVPTIGILSPFRAQVDWLRARVESEFPGALVRHRLIVGTAHSFQGAERDVMLLSFCVDAESSPMSFRFLDKSDVFNVSVTRAKFLQMVFHSFAASDAPPGSLAGGYLGGLAAAGQPAGADSGACRDGFASEVIARLAALHPQLAPLTAVDLAGTTVDIVVQTGDRFIGIDLIGYPGPHSPAISLERLLTLQRAGLHVHPLPFSQWRINPDRCLEGLFRAPSGPAP